MPFGHKSPFEESRSFWEERRILAVLCEPLVVVHAAAQQAAHGREREASALVADASAG